MILHGRETPDNAHQNFIRVYAKLISQKEALGTALGKLLDVEPQTYDHKLSLAANAKPIVDLCTLLLRNNHYSISRQPSKSLLDKKKEPGLQRSIITMKYVAMVCMNYLASPSFADKDAGARPTG